MQEFINKYRDQINGTLSGFDRLVLRGSLRRLNYGYWDQGLQSVVAQGMEQYLWQNHILFKNYLDHVKHVSQKVKQASVKPFESRGLPVEFLRDPSANKDEIARAIATKQRVESGWVCALSSVEPSPSFEHRGTHLVRRTKPCQVLYQYQIHPQVGWMYARIQTWFPFNIQVGLNGREWLSRQMDRQEMEYQRKENCFTWISHCKGAQRLMDKQLELNWPEQLDRILRQNHPLACEICRPLGLSYYWTTQESEFATDLMFKSPKPLSRIYPVLVRHAITSFSSADVMRFLGHRVAAHGKVHGKFKGEVVSDLKERPEGIRVKHTLNANSIKMYDKQGSVLRVETTINRTRDFRVYRERQTGPHGPGYRPQTNVGDTHARRRRRHGARCRAR
jgi:hypothetical protein